MPSINIDLAFFDHPKVKRLAGLLGKGSEVLPIRLWCYCGTFCPESGRLTETSTQEVESIMCWWGTSGKAVEALVKVVLLEIIENGFQVHDWLEHEGHLMVYRRRAKNAAKKRWLDASSIASSNNNHASSNAHVLPCSENLISSNSKDKENAQNARVVFEKSPELLSREWVLRFRGTSGRERDVGLLTPFFSEWLENGGQFDVILAGMKKKRDATEATWEFKRRLTGHGKKPEAFAGLKEFAVRSEKT